MRSMKASTKIEEQFEATGKAAAVVRGLEFERAALQERTTDRQARRTWVFSRKHADAPADRLHLIHFKTKAAAGPYRYDWGVTGKILDAVISASARVPVPWSLLLLEGSTMRGYCLPASEVATRQPNWEYFPHEDQLKIMEAPLPTSFYFRNLDELFRLLGL